MQLYPEVTTSISESWQTGKWCDEVPLEELSPMWADWERAPDRHFYVNEVARMTSGQYILPKRWIIVDKKECAEGHPVYFDESVSRTKFKPIFTLNILPARDVSGSKGGYCPCSSR